MKKASRRQEDCISLQCRSVCLSIRHHANTIPFQSEGSRRIVWLAWNRPFIGRRLVRATNMGKTSFEMSVDGDGGCLVWQYSTVATRIVCKNTQGLDRNKNLERVVFRLGVFIALVSCRCAEEKSPRRPVLVSARFGVFERICC